MLGESSNIVVAMDHAPLGLAPGLDDVDYRIGQILEGRPDGLIANYGLLKYVRPLVDPAQITLIARLDGNRTYLAGDWTASGEWELFYTVEDCASIGACAAIVNLLLGGPAELASLSVVARAAVACQAASVPLLVSAMYVPPRSPADNLSPNQAASQVDQIAAKESGRRFSARMAFELGADYVIAYDTALPDSLTSISRWCPAPLLAQGAPKHTEADLTTWARACISYGARGVVVGQAIWQADDPTAIVASLREAVNQHGTSSLSTV